MGIYITLPLYITLSFCFLLLLYLLFNLISLLYLLYYYIFSFTRRVWNTLRGLFTSYLFYYLLLLFSYIYFFLYYIFTILPYSLYLSSLLPVGCYTPTGLGYIFLSLSISSHCLPYSFYTIPDLSVLPLWHTFLLYYP